MGECGAPGDVNSNVLVARSTGDAQLDKAVWQWLSWDKVKQRRLWSDYACIWGCSCQRWENHQPKRSSSIPSDSPCLGLSQPPAKAVHPMSH